ncbi:phytanoyl-CoA dioxygenase family protein [Xylona heveae TC161]|uniref:Phytanoyl-CoA dioxygenase family protein n=1 Tax=Xylona heveae (strain CBS 132557 / TC161) TaxID=1328760 RepID=A0A165H5P4_XYLHT|nr:phytanoyl-CoA dioxygenase family protein [Xylona heveae TC161]KZF23021.1 phytanoyl-CoA dioxygenase family protein [Xylona heveae TC161]
MSPSQTLSSLPLSVQVSKDELAAGKLSWQNLELATRALHRDGLVVLEDVIGMPELNTLNEKMVKDALELQARNDDSPYNYNKGNIQQDPPLTPPYFSPSIFLNPIATQVTTSVLGPRPRLTFISGNTALPPTESAAAKSQPVHSDADFDHPDCPFALVVNVPLVSMNKVNGSTEVWLGTHSTSSLSAQEGAHGDRASGRIKQDLLDQRRAVRPPSQPRVKKGSIIIRDLRLWHAGKPNFSEDIRVMLALIHFAPWYRNAMTVEFSSELRPILHTHTKGQDQGQGLQIQAEFLPTADIEKRYLHKPFGNAYDFDQMDKVQGIFEMEGIF